MTILMLFLQASVVMSVAAGFEGVALSRASAASRHWLWTLTVAALLALPIVRITVPPWTVLHLALTPEAVPLIAPAPVPAFEAGVSLAAVDAAVRPEALSPFPSTRRAAARALNAWNGLPLVYGIGVLWFVVRVWRHHRAAWSTVEAAEPMTTPDWPQLLRDAAVRAGVRRLPLLLQSADHTTPFAIGLRRPVVVMPAIATAWTVERRRAVLLHELTHVARHDTLLQLAGELCAALYWLHPGAWWVRRRLHEERELACDDIVVTLGEPADEYATHLLEIAYAAGRPPLTATGMAGRQRLETRLQRLLQRVERSSPSRRFRATAVAVAAIVGIGVGSATISTRAQVPAVRHEVLAGAFGQDAVAAVSERARQLFVRVAGTIALLDELDAQGYARPSASEWLDIHRRGVTIAYVRELGSLGYHLQRVSAVVDFIDHGIDGEFIRGLAARGLHDLTPDELMAASRSGVLPTYIDGLAQLGLTPLSLESLIAAQRGGVDPPYVGSLQRLGYDWALLDLIRAQQHGIGADWIQGFRSIGYTSLSLDEAVSLTRRGVTVDDARRANAQAGAQLSVGQLTALAARGWRS